MMAVNGQETTLEDLLQQSPSIPDSRYRNPSCCCGRASCAYLSHNNAALDDLEKDVRTAAQLGQALLVRHEAYMAEAEESRQEMTARIESLEKDKKMMEAENARTIEENRGLLNQLEDLNSTMADSDVKLKSLESSLQSTQQELRRMENLASRTQELEIQLVALEQEQEILQKTIATSEEDERSAIQRWKRAEREVYEMQEQLEKIEREAREERERHVEVVGRIERRRIVEKELDSSGSRLKGAAMASTLGQGNNGSNVVSHFVKDILQDNANLQSGIVELREMLMNSNDEVHTLREQLMLHQPVDEQKDDGNATPTLMAELELKEPPAVSQELHIHHHYHTPAKKDETRRPKKKRNSITPMLFTPPNGNQSRINMRPTPPSTAAAILSHTSITVPGPSTPINRWSMHSVQTVSDHAVSSVPSSPQSNYRNSNLFDRGYVDQMLDFSQPASPGSSIDPFSPTFKPYHRKHDSEHSARSFIALTAFQPGSIIPEEDSDVTDLPDLQGASDDVVSPDDTEQSLPSLDSEETMSSDDMFTPYAFKPTLRRSTSHESILSISGIDIHTLKSRPSQLTITDSGALLRTRARHGYSSPTTSYVSMQPETTPSVAIVRPTLSRKGHNSSTYLRSNMGFPERPATRNLSGSNEGLTKKVGGWVWSKWGMSPTASPEAIVSKTLEFPMHKVQQAASTTAVDPLRVFMGRPPGINQKGPILGFQRSSKAPSQVTPERVDRDALREILEE